MTRFHKNRSQPAGGLKDRFDRPWRVALGIIGALGVAIALFLLLRPSSDIHTLPLPNWAIFRWVDEHGQLRNLPAFAILSVPFLVLARGRRERRIVVWFLAGFIAVTEFCQLAIPTRFFDLADIAEGWAGVAIVWSIMELIAGIARRRYARRKLRSPSPATLSPTIAVLGVRKKSP
jgi:hypothetical protein